MSSTDTDPAEELLESDPDLETREPGAEADVPAGAEGQVGVRVPADVESVGLREGVRVAVRRDVPEGGLVAPAHRSAVKVEIPGEGAPEVHGHRGPAEDLLGGRLEQRPVAMGFAEGVVGGRMIEQRQEAVGNGVAGGLVARHDEQQEEVLELQFGERPASGILGEHRGDDVFGRTAEPLLADPARVFEDGARRRAPERQQAEGLGVLLIDDRHRKLGVGVRDQRVPPLHEFAGVLLGNAQDAAEHPDGQLAGDLLHEVQLAQLEGPVEHAGGELTHRFFAGGDGFSGKAGPDQPAKPGVLGAVVLHHRAAGGQLVVVEFLEPDAAGAGEVARRRTGLEDMRVPGERPEAGPVFLLDPAGGSALPHPLEEIPRHPQRVGVVGNDRLEAAWGFRPSVRRHCPDGMPGSGPGGVGERWG